MFTLIAENQYQEQLELTHNPAYTITDIDGIDPPDALINTTHNAGADGSEYNSAYVNNRQITITLVVNAPAEVNRINLYKYFKSKFPVRLYYTNASREVFIDGYVQNISVGYFDKKQTIQIVIFCPKPYFNGVSDSVQEFASVIALFEFPFSNESITENKITFSELLIGLEKSIINNGDVTTGVIITIQATGQVVNPKIYNVETRESLILNVTLKDGDLITINTRQSEKAITLLRDGVTSNLIGSLEQGSTWFTLQPGDNVFTTAADTLVENMLVTFTITDQYEGV